MEPAAVEMDPPVPGGGRDDDGDGDDTLHPPAPPFPPAPQQRQQQRPSRYESQKRRDWNTFLQFLSNHYKPGLPLARCAGSHVVEFLKYLDQFGKTKVHAAGCTHFGLLQPPGPCGCPTRQAWGSLDALIGRLRAAYYAATAAGGPNPFGSRAVKAHLREVRESQAKARGVAYDKKKGKRRHQMLPPPSVEGSSSAATVAAATSTSVTVAVAGSSIATATHQGGSARIRDPGHADEAGNLTSDS